MHWRNEAIAALRCSCIVLAMRAANMKRACELPCAPWEAILDDTFIYRGDRETPELHDQEKAIAEALGRMLTSPEPPTGIMTSFDSVGEMVYLLLNRLGVKMPDEVSLISFGGTRRSNRDSTQFELRRR